MYRIYINTEIINIKNLNFVIKSNNNLHNLYKSNIICISLELNVNNKYKNKSKVVFV